MKELFRYLMALAALLAFWQIGSVTLGEFLLPRPLEVLAYFGDSLTTGAFWQHAGASAWRVVSAMSLAWIVAFPLGLILGHVRAVDNTLSPLVFLTYPLPKIVLLPLFLTLFGLGDLPRVLLIALTTGYQILVVTRASARGLDKKFLDSFRSLGGSPVQTTCPHPGGPARRHDRTESGQRHGGGRAVHGRILRHPKGPRLPDHGRMGPGRSA